MITFDEMHKDKHEGKKKKSLSPVGQQSTSSESFSKDAMQAFTLIVALTLRGCVPGTAWTSSENVDADLFYLWVLFHLVPVLGDYARGEANSIVWCDNVIQHLDDRSKKAIRETGAVLVYLPRFPHLPRARVYARARETHTLVLAGRERAGGREGGGRERARGKKRRKRWW